MKKIEVGTKIKLNVENIVVNVIAVHGDQIRYEGENGERGVLLASRLNEEQIINEDQTVLEAIQNEFKNFEIVIKSKGAKELVKAKLIKREEYDNGVIFLTDFGKHLRVVTYENGNARVTAHKTYL